MSRSMKCFAKEMGVSATEVAEAMHKLGDAGVRAAEAGRNFRMVLIHSKPGQTIRFSHNGKVTLAVWDSGKMLSPIESGHDDKP